MKTVVMSISSRVGSEGAWESALWLLREGCTCTIKGVHQDINRAILAETRRPHGCACQDPRAPEGGKRESKRIARHPPSFHADNLHMLGLAHRCHAKARSHWLGNERDDASLHIPKEFGVPDGMEALISTADAKE